MAFLLDPRMWDDDKVVGVSIFARQIFQFGITGPLRSNLPGLIKNASIRAIEDGVHITREAARALLIVMARAAKQPKLRASLLDAADLVMHEDDSFATNITRQGLQELVEAQLVEYDATFRVLRLPNAPKHNTCKNGSVLVSWYRAWRDTPNCEVKYRHLDSLRAAAEMDHPTINLSNANTRAAWDDTFGKVNVRSLTARADGGQLPLAIEGTVGGTVGDTVTPDQDQDQDQDLDHRSRSHNGGHSAPHSGGHSATHTGDPDLGVGVGVILPPSGMQEERNGDSRTDDGTGGGQGAGGAGGGQTPPPASKPAGRRRGAVAPANGASRGRRVRPDIE